MKETFFIRIIRHRKSGFYLNFQLKNVIFNIDSIHIMQPTNDRIMTEEEEPSLLGPDLRSNGNNGLFPPWQLKYRLFHSLAQTTEDGVKFNFTIRVIE